MKIMVTQQELDKIATRNDILDAAFDLAYVDYESISTAKKLAVLLLRIENLEEELSSSKQWQWHSL